MTQNRLFQDLNEKVAIVTGGARGLGRAIAQALAAHGVAVVIADIMADLGEETAANIRKAGGAVRFAETDVGEHAQIRALIEETLAREGRLDIVVNNAYASVWKGVVELEEEEWDRSMDVSLKSVYLFGKYAFPAMMAVGGGAMVNVSSVHGLAAHPNYPVYAAAKAAMLNLTRQMAIDGGPHNIRVNAICPGWIETGNDPLKSDRLKLALKLYPLKRSGRPDEIADAALFLASSMSSFVTGHALVVDGGLTACLPDMIVSMHDP